MTRSSVGTRRHKGVVNLFAQDGHLVRAAQEVPGQAGDQGSQRLGINLPALINQCGVGLFQFDIPFSANSPLAVTGTAQHGVSYAYRLLVCTLLRPSQVRVDVLSYVHSVKPAPLFQLRGHQNALEERAKVRKRGIDAGTSVNVPIAQRSDAAQDR